MIDVLLYPQLLNLRLALAASCSDVLAFNLGSSDQVSLISMSTVLSVPGNMIVCNVGDGRELIIA